MSAEGPGSADARREALLCGIDEVKNLLAHALASADPDGAAGYRAPPREQ